MYIPNPSITDRMGHKVNFMGLWDYIYIYIHIYIYVCVSVCVCICLYIYAPTQVYLINIFVLTVGGGTNYESFQSQTLG